VSYTNFSNTNLPVLSDWIWANHPDKSMGFNFPMLFQPILDIPDYVIPAPHKFDIRQLIFDSSNYDFLTIIY